MGGTRETPMQSAQNRTSFDGGDVPRMGHDRCVGCMTVQKRKKGTGGWLNQQLPAFHLKCRGEGVQRIERYRSDVSAFDFVNIVADQPGRNGRLFLRHTQTGPKGSQV